MIDLCMNTASTVLGTILIPILGTILIPISGIVWESFPEIIIHKISHIDIFWIAALFFAAFIHAFIENFVISAFFKCKLGWRGFWWLSLANGLRVAVVFIFHVTMI